MQIKRHIHFYLEQTADKCVRDNMEANSFAVSIIRVLHVLMIYPYLYFSSFTEISSCLSAVSRI